MKKEPRKDYRICVCLDKQTWDAIQKLLAETNVSAVIRKLILKEIGK